MPRTTKNYAQVSIRGGIPVQNGGAMAVLGTTTPSEGGLTLSARGNPITQVVSSKKAVKLYYGSNMAGLLNGPYNGNAAPAYVRRPVSTAVFATQNTAGQWVGIKMATVLAGASNTLLMSGGAYPKNGRKWPSYRNSRYTLKQISAGWNRSSGRFLVTPAITQEYYGNGFASPGRDDAATNPSTSNSFGYSRIPGEFVYLTSSKIPSRAEFSKANLD